jgi:pimeloyl-ACP methyl ester carboxylesterase
MGVTLAVLLGWCGATLAQTEPDDAASRLSAGEVVISQDASQYQRHIRIPARNGNVAWSDVLETLMQLGHLNDKTLRDKMPDGALNLQSSYSRSAILAANLVLRPDIRLQLVVGDKEQPDHLLVVVDEKAVQARKRQVAKRLRERLSGAARDKERPSAWGLQLPDKWPASDAIQPLVLVLHGFNSSPQRFAPLAQALQEQGFVCGTYSYPDDQPILESAAMLAHDLTEIKSRQPGRRVALVAHSMGGLVARAMLEDPEFDPGNVTKLIMVAPPNQGSLLARVGYGTDLLDHAVAEVNRKELSRFYAAIEDGLSEATVDLQPDSVFLRELNARPRNPHVKYSILLGTGARLTREQVDQLRQSLATAESKSRVVALFARRVDETLADLDEVVQGAGDGAVALKRGRLEGVEDVVILNFTHLGVLQGAGVAADPAFPEVVKRLRAE